MPKYVIFEKSKLRNRFVRDKILLEQHIHRGFEPGL